MKNYTKPAIQVVEFVEEESIIRTTKTASYDTEATHTGEWD